MASLPPIQNLKKEDFPGESWAEKLLWPINKFMSSIYNALNKNLTFAENFRGVTRQVDFINTASNLPIQFPWELRGSRPTDLWISSVTPLESGATPTAGVWAEWSYDGQAISVTQVTGLVSNKKYQLRFIAVSG